MQLCSSTIRNRHSAIALLGVVLHFAAGSAQADDSAAFNRLVKPFLARHCYDCHGAQEQNAQLRYDTLNRFRPEDRHLWTLIHEQLLRGAMPPKGQPQPDAVEKQMVLDWIAAQQQAIGVPGTRRLNRRELAAALRDVTGLSMDYAHALPGDGKLNGFDTGAETLQDAADSVTQLVEVARRAVDALRFLDPPGSLFAVDLRNVKDVKKAFEPIRTKGESVSTGDTVNVPGTGLLIKPKWLGERGGLTIRMTPPEGRLGVLRLMAVVSVKKFRQDLPNPRLWVEVGGKDLDYAEITNPPEEPRTLTYEVQLADVAIDPKGVSIELCNRVEVPYAVEGFENDEKGKPEDNIAGGTGLFRPLFDRKSPFDQHPVPYVVLHSIQIETDYRAAWPPSEWGADVSPIKDNEASARRLLELWMERAWRRPVSTREQERFLSLYKELRAGGLSFDAALRAAFQSVLLSGSFRYLTSPGAIDTPQTQHALASRLSFMLWGAPPDEELRRLAAEGKLRDAAILEAQADRLLNDSRSEQFWQPFVRQWLVMDQPITIAMDHIQKQDFRFGRYLKASMQEETVGYVRQLLAENRPARELVSSDWTLMNDILARHYGYQGIEGGHLRKVTLRPDDPRGGGILSHAGIQSMLCWMGENWLIYRGAWALRHILDDPPPPPPEEVPVLIPTDSTNHGTSFRELLQQHQEDARCAVCHKTSDPLGFAFQNFDLSGRWRDVEYHHYVRNELDGKIEWRGAGETRPVDASGRLPRGEVFTSFSECKQLLVENYQDDIVRGLLKNLVIYGAGRTPDIEDLRVIRQIMAAHKDSGYPLRDMLKALLSSRAFVER